MLDKIFNLFFEKDKKSNCITIIKNREVKEDVKTLKKTPTLKNAVKSELSNYFCDCKGLNRVERENFSHTVFMAHKQRWYRQFFYLRL